MKLTFKDLKQQKFTIEAEPSDTIASLKEKISVEKGWDVSTQKLIYSGKILQDDLTIESYKIEEKGFVVCMTSKPKAAPKPAEPATPAKTASTPAPPAAPVAVTQNTAAQPPATPSPAPAASAGGAIASAGTPSSFNDPSALALGAQRAEAISNMESMGFPRDEIDRAMRAAFFNPDRAVEYLLNGIPENARAEEQQQQAAQQPRPASRPATGAQAATGQTGAATTQRSAGDEPVNLFEQAAAAQSGGGQGGGNRGASDLASALGAGAGGAGGEAGQGGGANLDFLRNNPQFQQLRQVVQQQPEMLEPILQQVAAGNPQLAQIITQNPEQFMHLLAEEGDDVALPPGAQQISVTEEEREAIERLCRLGFERDLVIQAYFACDKNEELAANFLFEQPDEADESGA